jgi:hypothetical protein
MIAKFSIFRDKLYESLPRQSTVDQLKRIRAEIMGNQEVKIGPETKTMHSDIGDRVISDLKKHQQNNLFWWDNPIDRYICSYEDFVKNDARKSLGYTVDDDKKPVPTDIPEKDPKKMPKSTDTNTSGLEVVKK